MHRDLEADILLLNGTVITINPEQPRAEAVALKNGRIQAVGFSRDIQHLRAPNTEIIDLKGKTVIPGFNDAHNHMAAFGMQLQMVPLHYPEVKSTDDIIKALKEVVNQQEPGTWIKGAGYDNNKLPAGQHPTRWDLDKISEHHYVFARHTSGHMCVVNSKVLALLKIDRDTPDPEGGHIARDANGEPTGLLQETAFHLVTSHFYPYSIEEITDALAAADKVYLSEGITSHTEAGIGYLSDLELLAYQRAVQEGKLNIRSYLMVRAESLFQVRGATGETFFGLSQGIRTGWGDERLRIGPIKMFSDGSLIGRTAAMSEGYASEPDNYGLFATPEATLRDWILRGHQSGWQIAVHAIGDRAVSFILDCYEEANTCYPRNDCRHRIEHCGLVSPAMLQRIKTLGVIPVPQQHFIGELGDGFIEALGPERSRWCYVQKSFLDLGVPMPGSSDRYVVQGAPLLGIHDAVNQTTSSGRPYVPEERILPEQAIRAYTLNSAYASFEEHLKGSVEAGKIADLTVLGGDPTVVEASEIAHIPVHGTLVGGELLFSHDLD